MTEFNGKKIISHKPFDLLEAIILLDVYLSVKKKGASYAKSAEIASMKLRALAKNRGMEISDDFRSPAGLINRLRSIANIYEGKPTNSVPETRVFLDVVSLYNKKPKKYYELLENVATNIDFQIQPSEDRGQNYITRENKSNEHEFFDWMKSNVKPDVYKEIKSSYKSISALLMQKKVLKQPVTSTMQVEQINYALRKAKAVFVGKKFRAKAEIFLSQYLSFLKNEDNYGKIKENDYTKLRAPHNSIPIEMIESYLKTTGLNGATVEQIIDKVQPDASVYPTKNALDSDLNIIAMPGKRYVASVSFVDLNEAEEKMKHILKTHFVQFGGYSNSKLLYGAASRDLSMFLNDNDCDDLDSVYCLAQYFFDKGKTTGKYIFSYPHIFEKEPNYPLNLKGLMINLARTNGGLLNVDEAKSYLNKTLLSYGNLNQLLQISNTNTFLRYDKDLYLLSESISINENWKNILHDKLDNLFCQENVAFIIPRDISNVWLSSLPALPQNLGWTILLLQELLRNFPDIGFRSIGSGLEQNMDTISAAFVPKDSPIQTFPDLVSLYLNERYSLPIRLTSEELRHELLDAGMLEGRELIYALPKALNDFRFSWTDEDKKVLVREN